MEQLEAFRRDDFDAAYRYASAEIGEGSIARASSRWRRAAALKLRSRRLRRPSDGRVYAS
jgi:hypothetical protein